MPASQQENFDWVVARSKCSLGLMFEVLQTAVKQDVDSRNEQLSQLNDTSTKFSYHPDRRVAAVVRERFGVGASECRTSIKFVLSSVAITVEQDSNLLFSIKPSLNQDGRCKMMVDAETQEYEVWQVCRRALEKLFFEALG